MDIKVTTAPGHALRLAQEAAQKGSDLVIVAGGDGTINEVINGLVGTTTALAILPTGTGNSLAREVGLPLNPLKAVEAMREGEIRAVHLGWADGRYFGLMIGIGFDAHAVHHVPYRVKRLLGRVGYVLAGFVSLLRYSYPLFWIVVDGKPLRASTVIISKSRYYASAFRVAPRASLQAPLLQICAFTGRGIGRYLRYVLAVIFNRHHHLSDVILMDAHEVHVKAVPGLLAHMDGEALPALPASVRLADERVNILFPK